MNPVGAGGGAQIQFARDVCDKVRVWDVVAQDSVRRLFAASRLLSSCPQQRCIQSSVGVQGEIICDVKGSVYVLF